MNEHEKINYVEFSAKDIEATKAFFVQAFGWAFEGFRSELHFSSMHGGALIVFYSNNIESTHAKIEAANGVIVKEIFIFPGGYRFHFTEPGGNEFAVWSDITV